LLLPVPPWCQVFHPYTLPDAPELAISNLHLRHTTVSAPTANDLWAMFMVLSYGPGPKPACTLQLTCSASTAQTSGSTCPPSLQFQNRPPQPSLWGTPQLLRPRSRSCGTCWCSLSWPCRNNTCISNVDMYAAEPAHKPRTCMQYVAAKHSAQVASQCCMSSSLVNMTAGRRHSPPDVLTVCDAALGCCHECVMNAIHDAETVQHLNQHDETATHLPTLPAWPELNPTLA
jgi:hypothetical protein